MGGLVPEIKSEIIESQIYSPEGSDAVKTLPEESIKEVKLRRENTQHLKIIIQNMTLNLVSTTKIFFIFFNFV